MHIPKKKLHKRKKKEPKNVANRIFPSVNYEGNDHGHFN